MNNIDELITKIKNLESELIAEIQQQQKNSSYLVEEKRITFDSESLQHHKKHQQPLTSYLTGC